MDKTGTIAASRGAMARIRIACALLLCTLAPGAGAAELPDGRRFTDPDRAASYLQAPPGGRAKLRARVNAALVKNPRNVAALTHRAYFFLEGGDTERAVRDFTAAAAAAEPGSDTERHLLWSRGWAHYESGQHDDALRDWRRAIALHGGRPFWAAYTFALLYWTRGENDAALAWFDVAAASNPQWGTADGLEAKIRHWKPAAQARMRALHAAWRTRQHAFG